MRLLTVIALGLSTLTAGAQTPEPALEPAPEPAAGLVRIETNAPAARVYLDGRLAGAASEGAFAVAPGTVAVRLMESDEAAWDPRWAEATVEVGEGETATLELRLPLRYRIETFPVGAAVALETEAGTEPLGVAPLVVEREAPLRGTLVAEAPGFMPARALPGDSLTNRLTLVLRPLEEGAMPETASGWLPERRPNRWIDYAVGAAAVTAAAVSVHYKFRADEVDDRYRQVGGARRGDPALRAEAERLDGYALAALGVMQVSLGVLAVRFILR